MKQCPGCHYLLPDEWIACKRCGTDLVTGAKPQPASALDTRAAARAPTSAPPPAPAPVREASVPPALRFEPLPAWQPSPGASPAKPAAPPWSGGQTTSLGLMATGVVLILLAAFALPWMHFSGLVSADLSYRQMQRVLSKVDTGSRLSLDLGPWILAAEVVLVAWQLWSVRKVDARGLAAPFGLACLVLYVAYRIDGLASDVQFAAGQLGLHAHVGFGPWVALAGCACLAAGVALGARHRPEPRFVTDPVGQEPATASPFRV